MPEDQPEELTVAETLRVVMCRVVKSYDRLRRLAAMRAPNSVIEKELGTLHRLADLLTDVTLHAQPHELVTKR